MTEQCAEGPTHLLVDAQHYAADLGAPHVPGAFEFDPLGPALANRDYPGVFELPELRAPFERLPRVRINWASPSFDGRDGRHSAANVGLVHG